MCIAAPIMMGLSTGISAISQIQQGKAQAAAYQSQAAASEQNARIAARQAQDAAIAGAKEEQQMKQHGAAVAGQQRAAYSASGLDIGAGSPLDILRDTIHQNTLDVLNVRQGAANNVWGYQAQETNYLNQAVTARAAAANAKKAGTMGAIGSLLNGVAAITAMRDGMPGSLTSSSSGTGSSTASAAPTSTKFMPNGYQPFYTSPTTGKTYGLTPKITWPTMPKY